MFNVCESSQLLKSVQMCRHCEQLWHYTPPHIQRVVVTGTLGAAGPPQTRVGQDLLVLADGLVVVLALGAAHPAGVQPVVRAHRDGHEAEGAESPRCGQQHHHTPVTQPHVGPAASSSSSPSSSSSSSSSSTLRSPPVDSGVQTRSETFTPGVLSVKETSSATGAGLVWQDVRAGSRTGHVSLKLHAQDLIHWVMTAGWRTTVQREVGGEKIIKV